MGACFAGQNGQNGQNLEWTADPTVTLHIYDVGRSEGVETVNKLLRHVGTGAFHAAVEIYGMEWSFGGTRAGSGVFSCPPKQCGRHHYRESLPLGQTNLYPAQVEMILGLLQQAWQGPDYDLLLHNCCHFSAAFADALAVQPVPKWVTNLAGAGATLNKGIHYAHDAPGNVANAAGNSAIIQAAKQGLVGAEYAQTGAIRAKMQHLMSGALSPTRGQQMMMYDEAGNPIPAHSEPGCCR